MVALSLMQAAKWGGVINRNGHYIITGFSL